MGKKRASTINFTFSVHVLLYTRHIGELTRKKSMLDMRPSANQLCSSLTARISRALCIWIRFCRSADYLLVRELCWSPVPVPKAVLLPQSLGRRRRNSANLLKLFPQKNVNLSPTSPASSHKDNDYCQWRQRENEKTQQSSDTYDHSSLNLDTLECWRLSDRQPSLHPAESYSLPPVISPWVFFFPPVSKGFRINLRWQHW
jgi:hypothetical protein